MNKIKIGVLDREQEYVTKLANYLQRYGKGKWDLSAFTEEESVSFFLEKRTLDILVGTDRNSLLRLQKDKGMTGLWLTEERSESAQKEKKFYVAYRFQSAEEIAKCIEGIVRQERGNLLQEKQMVAVYSPVGRCGKTTLSLDVVTCKAYGRWLYVGMEDYSSCGEYSKKIVADEVLYYWKERKWDKLMYFFGQVEDVLATGSSFYDIRQLEAEDIKWFREGLQKSDYQGAIFDIGSGVLKNLDVLGAFDIILVPYVGENGARIKKENFKELLTLHGIEDMEEKVHFLNMDKETEVKKRLQQIIGGQTL